MLATRQQALRFWYAPLEGLGGIEVEDEEEVPSLENNHLPASAESRSSLEHNSSHSCMVHPWQISMSCR